MSAALRISPSPEPIVDSSPRTLAAAYLGTRSEVVHYRAEFFGRARYVYVREEREELRGRLAEWLSRQFVLDDGGRPALYKPNARRVNDVLDALSNIAQAYEVKTMPAWLDGGKNRPDPANIISFCNGILDIAEFIGGEVRMMPPNAAWFSTTVLPFNFDERAPRPAGWWNFLTDLWPEDDEAIALLQEWFGYCLSADTRQQKILLLAGPPRSGKGTIARILEKLLGPDNVAGPTLAGLASNFGLASLIGKPLATIADARLSGRTDQAIVTERLLSISGEDALTIDRKNRDAITLRLPTRLTLLSNELPKLSDASGALAERFLILPLKRSFLGDEDTELTNKLSAELPGILLWALDGLKRLRARGRFVMPASGNEAMEELRELVSPIKSFVRDRCVIRPGLQSSAAQLYEAWGAWCKEQGREHPGTLSGFARDIRAALPAVAISRPRTESGDRPRMYEGIGLNPPI